MIREMNPALQPAQAPQTVPAKQRAWQDVERGVGAKLPARQLMHAEEFVVGLK